VLCKCGKKAVCITSGPSAKNPNRKFWKCNTSYPDCKIFYWDDEVPQFQQLPPQPTSPTPQPSSSQPQPALYQPRQAAPLARSQSHPQVHLQAHLNQPPKSSQAVKGQEQAQGTPSGSTPYRLATPKSPSKRPLTSAPNVDYDEAIRELEASDAPIRQSPNAMNLPGDGSPRANKRYKSVDTDSRASSSDQTETPYRRERNGDDSHEPNDVFSSRSSSRLTMSTATALHFGNSPPSSVGTVQLSPPAQISSPSARVPTTPSSVFSTPSSSQVSQMLPLSPPADSAQLFENAKEGLNNFFDHCIRVERLKLAAERGRDIKARRIEELTGIVEAQNKKIFDFEQEVAMLRREMAELRNVIHNQSRK